MGYKLSFKRFGEHAILVDWPSRIHEDILKDIIQFKQAIEQSLEMSHLVLFKSAYHSLLIEYAKGYDDFDTEIDILRNIYNTVDNAKFDLRRTLWTVPVCYDDDLGTDMASFSKKKKLSKSEIIKYHSQGVYTVYFIGFLPGFLYLGGLDKKLYMPRKATPKLNIEPGAVAIGGKQTGVYPSESPGGWHVIGNSPISFFDINKPQPCFASLGDQIIFKPITKDQYREIKLLVEAGVYPMESEVIDA